MKLHARFLQLPIEFDAELLAREIATIAPSDWKPHPLGFAGNDFLPLIAVNGDPDNEGFAGPMRPTPFLSADRPYLTKTLGSLGAVLGRTRLMRLSGHAEVSEHADVNYYWRDRMRVHVPIVTQPTVSFHCANVTVHMAPGECWVFDTWSLHRVVNDQTHARIHLVADTVGGEGFMRLLAAGRSPERPAPNWSARLLEAGGAQPAMEFEATNLPKVMSPWEMREHLTFLLGEAMPNQPAAADVARACGAFLHRWRALWAAFGEAEAGAARYRATLNQFVSDLKAARAGDLLLKNEVDFLETFNGMILSSALSISARPATPDQSRGNAA
ncbi:MAG: aspartyl/asparaginyl beta-hydroxylase domain-containing protein [Hyphomonadaceae bacterium]